MIQRVLMVRRSLNNVPCFVVPEGFRLRWYQPGDEASWLSIHLAAEHHEPVTPEWFTRRFGSNAGILSRRQAYLLAPGGQAIGTATAWYDPSFEGREFGRVHYVAVVPEYQGRGLSKPLMTSVLVRLKELGHDRAYLATSSARLAAINLYRRFGFEPLIRARDEQSVWQKILQELDSARAG